MHNHYCFEINLALSSGGKYYIGDGLYPIDKGDIFGDSVLTFFDLFLKLLDSHLRRLDSTDMLKHFFLIDFLNYYFCRNIAPFKIHVHILYALTLHFTGLSPFRKVAALRRAFPPVTLCASFLYHSHGVL